MMISNRAYKKIKLKQQNNNYTSICFTNNIFILLKVYAWYAGYHFFLYIIQKFFLDGIIIIILFEFSYKYYLLPGIITILP